MLDLFPRALKEHLQAILKWQHARERPKRSLVLFSKILNEAFWTTKGLIFPCFFLTLLFLFCFYRALLSTAIQKFYLSKAGLKVVTPGSLSLMMDSHAFQNVFHLFPFNQLGRKKRGQKSVLIADTLLWSSVAYLQGIFDAVSLCPKLI